MRASSRPRPSVVPRFLIMIAAAAALTALFVAPAVAAPPANDNFADAEVLASDPPVSVNGTNVDATREEGEPNHNGSPGVGSVWYSWTPTDVEIDMVRMRVCSTGSNFYGLIGLYTGDSLDGLTEVHSLLSGCGDIIFEAAIGTTYRLAIDNEQGFPEEKGSFRITIEAIYPPHNDNFADAEPILDELPVAINGSNLIASHEEGEVGLEDTATVWYSWTPTADAPVILSACGSGEPEWSGSVIVYKGDELAGFTDVGSAMQCEGLAFDADADTTYRIQVLDGYVSGETWCPCGRQGSFVLVIRGGEAPANDNFADAQVISGALPVSVAGTNVGAGHELGEPGYEDSATVWYSWTPTAQTAGPISLKACGDDSLNQPLHGMVRLYTGSDLGSLTEISSSWNCDSILFEAIQGVTYRISVDDGWIYEGEDEWCECGDRGDFRLRLRSAHPPANDNFANATTLSEGGLMFVQGSTIGATGEPGEELLPHATERISSVWYRFTTIDQASMTIAVCNNNDLDLNFALYTGSSIGSLSQVGHVDQHGCEFTYALQAGTVYHLVVDSVDESQGEFQIEFFGDFTLLSPKPSNNFKLGKLKAKKNGTASISLKLPGAGKVEILGSKTVKKSSKTAKKAGTVKLTIKAKGKAAKTLKKKGKAKLKLKIRFKPTGGVAKTVTKKVTLKRKR